jgi:diadenosine tetraphosphatase ApaH/serine/threonine PP2A family protein phosphatase
MRLLIISDIHANLTALEAVLAHAEGQWDEIWCLGDVIGYGPDPNACVALLRSYKHTSLSGNHDWAVLGKLDVNTFNHEARAAIEWTQAQLTEENRSYLDALPAMLAVSSTLTLAHGSPRQPVWEYIVDPGTARANFAHFSTPFCLVGHTHVPAYFELGENGVMVAAPRAGFPLQLDPERQRLIINPGSVGQPRDDDPRAAYALLDLETWTWEHRRVPYDVSATQGRMREAGLPQRLIARLEFGW